MYPETLTGRCHQSPCEHQFYHVSAVGCNIRQDLKRLIFKKICQISDCCCPAAALEGPPAARPSPQYYLLLLLTLTAFLTNPYKSLQILTTKSSLFPAPAATDRQQYPYKSTIPCLPMYYAGLSCLRNLALYCVNRTNPEYSTKSCNMDLPSSRFAVL